MLVKWFNVFMLVLQVVILCMLLWEHDLRTIALVVGSFGAGATLKELYP